MFEDVKANDKVGVKRGKFLRIKILYESDVGRFLIFPGIGHPAPIETDPAISAHRTDCTEQVSLAAADIDDGSPAQPIAVDQMLADLSNVSPEPG
jgi:hypothetical protein